MTRRFNPAIHRRFSVRLKDHDYAKGGTYLVTMCAKNRECLFGEIVKGDMRLNDHGRIVEEEWKRTEIIRPDVQLDAWVVMPNHIHGILIIKSQSPCRGTKLCAPTKRPAFHYIVPRSLGAIIRGFKSSVTQRIRTLDDYQGDIWQRNYHEHVIRNSEELQRYRYYIRENPKNWLRDDENLDAVL